MHANWEFRICRLSSRVLLYFKGLFDEGLIRLHEKIILKSHPVYGRCSVSFHYWRIWLFNEIRQEAWLNEPTLLYLGKYQNLVSGVLTYTRLHLLIIVRISIRIIERTRKITITVDNSITRVSVYYAIINCFPTCFCSYGCGAWFYLYFLIEASPGLRAYFDLVKQLDSTK